MLKDSTAAGGLFCRAWRARSESELGGSATPRTFQVEHPDAVVEAAARSPRQNTTESRKRRRFTIFSPRTKHREKRAGILSNRLDRRKISFSVTSTKIRELVYVV
ncbi:MAG: hypothetical protein D6741_03715 [Planctomycetota bacterium]|nr:MAG: hypothetical protein D6741_03715 [Planctomycetota bacterium]